MCAKEPSFLSATSENDIFDTLSRYKPSMTWFFRHFHWVLVQFAFVIEVLYGKLISYE